ncbi:hypothetical protein L1049_001041 [Liquidambar formosana]|uniref:RING-type domain-containing protein n=1 Tax=Liquidambar formosana TaxID=63359 RepID=A0AAP0NC48_LIQFO
MKEWFSGLEKVVFRCKEVASLWVFAEMGGFGTGFLFRVVKRAVFAALTCIFVMGGAIVGTIYGAIKGQTTETGFFRGAAVGVVAGAITAVQLLESMVDGESLSKIALLGSLVNGKVFMEWVSPAVLKAYQWQISTLETTYREISDIYDTYRETSDIFDIAGIRGLSQNVIQKFPEYKFHSSEIIVPFDQICCTICLQDFEDGDSARRLPICKHFFHLDCIDKWLSRQGSCPVCREDVCKATKDT